MPRVYRCGLLQAPLQKAEAHWNAVAMRFSILSIKLRVISRNQVVCMCPTITTSVHLHKFDVSVNYINARITTRIAFRRRWRCADVLAQRITIEYPDECRTAATYDDRRFVSIN